MILALLGFAAIVVFTVFVARTAGENGRSAVGWAVACASAGFFFQWVLPFLIGMTSSIMMIALGTPPDAVVERMSGWFVLIGVVCFALSFAAMALILRRVAVIPDDEAGEMPSPPPPPRFDGHIDSK